MVKLRNDVLERYVKLPWLKQTTQQSRQSHQSHVQNSSRDANLSVNDNNNINRRLNLSTIETVTQSHLTSSQASTQNTQIQEFHTARQQQSQQRTRTNDSNDCNSSIDESLKSVANSVSIDRSHTQDQKFVSTNSSPPIPPKPLTSTRCKILTPLDPLFQIRLSREEATAAVLKEEQNSNSNREKNLSDSNNDLIDFESQCGKNGNNEVDGDGDSTRTTTRKLCNTKLCCHNRKTCGFYVIRSSETWTDKYVITFSLHGRVKHLRFCLYHDGQCRLQTLWFISIDHMIEYFIHHVINTGGHN